MLVSIVVPFLATLLLVLILSRLTSRWLAELLGARLYVVLLWPGVVVHEFSHLLGALLTFTRVKGFSLWPKSTPTGQVLGSVTHEATSNPVTLILISLFPILGGAFILFVLAQLLLPTSPTTAPVLGHTTTSSQVLLVYFEAWWNFIKSFWQALNFSTWQSWLFIYLVLCISPHLAPSGSDLAHTSAGFTALSVLAILVVWGGDLIGKPVGDLLLRWITESISFFIPLLSYALNVLILAFIVIGTAIGLRHLNERTVWW